MANVFRERETSRKEGLREDDDTYRLIDDRDIVNVGFYRANAVEYQLLPIKNVVCNLRHNAHRDTHNETPARAHTHKSRVVGKGFTSAAGERQAKKNSTHDIHVHLRSTPSFMGVVLAGLWSGMSLYNPPLDALIKPFFIWVGKKNDFKTYT